MPPQIRRAVTGHNELGKAIIVSDGPAQARLNPAGGSNAPIWTADVFPVDNTDGADGADRQLSSVFPANGTSFRMVEFAPNNTPRMHRTTTHDYSLVLSGEIDMLLDDGATTHVTAGGMVIKRGTMHGLANRGTEPCSIAFITIDALPATIADQTLEATFH